MKLKRIFISLLACFFTASLQAQNAPVDVVRIIPPSPTASAVAKYGEIPVSNYTGVPNISIPLYNIQNRELNVPITINYHAGGIKVEEEASWVGLGWSLMCGGSISRMVRGQDDLSKSSVRGFPDSYLPTSVDPITYKYMDPGDPSQALYDLDYLQNVLEGQDDSEPDIFVFNFNGHSGKFILKKRANPSAPLVPMLISPEDIKIEVSYNTQAANYQWIITDEKGIQYFFNTTEVTITRSGSGNEEWAADTNAPEGTPQEVVSTWYLNKILSPTGAEINFTYQSSYPAGYGTKRMLSRSQVKEHVTQLDAYNGCTVPMNKFTYFSTYTEVHDVYLKEITFPNGKIEFKLSDRADIEPVLGGLPLTYAQKVDEVDISAGSGSNFTLFKKYIFNYGYFGEDASYAGKRLKLLSVTESDGNNNRPPYLFSYNNIELPDKDSKSIDHWGYFNNAPNNQVNETTYGDQIFNGTLVPPATLYLPITNEWRSYAGADRNPNPSYAQAGMLTGITYPTGGTTNFTYELNDYYYPTMKEIETGQEKYAEKFGPDTQVPNVRPDTFIVELTAATTVKVYTSVECYGGSSCLDGGVEYEYDVANIKSVDGGTFNQWIGYLLTYENQADGELQLTTVDLPAGKYQFTVYSDQNYLSRLIADWTVKTTVPTYNQLGAGLRIKKIVTYDGISHANDQVTNYSYTTLKEVPDCSTGRLMVKPVYEYETDIEKRCETSYFIVNGISTVRSSSPLIPISDAAQGSPIGYDMVEVTNGNGKTVYEYLNQEDQLAFPNYPNVPTIPFGGNGLLVRETSYSEKADGTFQKVKQIARSYTIGINEGAVRAMKLPPGNAAQLITEEGYLPMYASVKFYDVISQWSHPDTDTIKLYSQQDQSLMVSKVTTYKYDNPVWHQVTEESTRNSNGKLAVTSYKYPYDFPGVAVYSQMTNANRISNIIEKNTTLDDVNLQTIKNNYATWQGNQTLPSSIDVKNGAWDVESRIRYHAYSANGLLLSQSKENDVKMSYKWGYNNQYPVVEIINAGPNDFYYESFEEGTNIGLEQAGAKTGKRVKSSGFIVYFSPPDQRSYLLSYWYKTSAAGQWLYKQVNYTGTSFTITDGTYIDEVRVCPADANMKSYTYDPLIGITSETDFTGRTIYYEYGAFNQLKLIKDQNGKILKQYDYQYQKPITQ